MHLFTLTSKFCQIYSGLQSRLKCLMESGFLMLRSGRDADFEIWGDASATSLAFWSPTHGVAYIADPVVDAEKQFSVFFNEALTILAALEWAATLELPPKCLAIHTDSMTSFSIFNSLRAISTYNPIILQSVKVWLKSKIDLRVFHIDGKKNTIADALSRC